MKNDYPVLNEAAITSESIARDKHTVALTLRLAGLSSDQTPRLWVKPNNDDELYRRIGILLGGLE